MSAIAIIVLGLMFAAFVFIGVGLVLPGQVHVERETTIQAPPERVFALVGDLKEWDAWSPWAKIDPEAKLEISGAGLGQTMIWSSKHPEVGTGSQEIVELEEPRFLRTHLQFDGQGEADATIAIEAEDEMTRVIWSMDSDVRKGVPLLMKPISAYFGFFINSSVGRSYETGLRNLKAVIEQG